MTIAEFIKACKECDTPQRAAELLQDACRLATKYVEQANLIHEYSEQVERLKAEIEDLTAELEDKRIQLAELGSLSTLIGRLGAVALRLEQADKPGAAEKQRDKPTAVKGQLSKKTDSKKPKSKASDFDEFWAVYPNKKDKTKSREIWEKLAPDEALKKKIIDAVKQQARSDKWTKDGGQFVPYPSTWLRRKRWEDEQTSPTVAESGDGVHSYDVEKILKYSKENIPNLKGGEK